jgi:hypothetical protein
METILEIAQAMAESESKADLDLIKSRHSEKTIKEAWKSLDAPIKDKIKLLCEDSKPELEAKPESKPTLPTPKTPKKPAKTNPKLWELSSEVINLENSIVDIQEIEGLKEDEKEILVSKLMENWLESGKEFDIKAVQVAHYIKHLEAITEARKAEYRRLRELAEQSEKQAERIRAYLVSNMERTGKKKINGVTASLSLRKKPAKVVLEVDAELLPLEFQKVEVTPRLTAIKEYLKSNPDCGFASMADNQGFSVTIK